MQTVVETVNFIRARVRNHRRFQRHLVTFDAEKNRAGLERKVSLYKRRPCAFLGDESAGPVSTVPRGYATIPGTFR